VPLDPDTTLLGTEAYLAPEVMARHSTGNLSTDIFSLGMVFLEIVIASVGINDHLMRLLGLEKGPSEAGMPESTSNSASERVENAKRRVNGIHKLIEDLIEELQQCVSKINAQHDSPPESESGPESEPQSEMQPTPHSETQSETQSVSTPDPVALRDLGILHVCREMLDLKPHLRPTVNGLRQWWWCQLRKFKEVEQECACACNRPAADGSDGDGAGGYRWRYSDVATSVSLRRAYENGHGLVAKALSRHEEVGMDRGTALVAAARGGLWLSVKKSLPHGDVSNRDEAGRTALHYLAGAGDLDCDDWNGLADALRDKGADVLAKDFDGRTPLRMAAENGNPNMIWRLVQPRDGKEKNMDAGVMLVRLLCEGRTGVPNVEATKAKLYRREVESGLLRCGSSNNNNNNNNSEDEVPGVDAYHEVLKEPPQICQLFDVASEIGGVDISDANGQTPLSIAAMHGHEGVVRLLLNQKADINAMDLRKRDALSMAASYGHDGIASLLLDQHAAAANDEAINRRDADGQTPLFKAADRGHLAVVKLLLGHGADTALDPRLRENPRLRDTALMRAATHGYGTIVSLLLENASDQGTGDIALPEPATHSQERPAELQLQLRTAIMAIEADEKNKAIEEARKEAANGGHWLVERILRVHSRRHGAQDSQPPGSVTPETLVIWNALRNWWATLVELFSKMDMRDPIWIAVMGMVAFVMVAVTLSHLPVDGLPGWKIVAHNRTEIPSPAA
jgi:ankyrin repeat protein